jgi:glycosyltransferase involved in cell wall biosynthesis
MTIRVLALGLRGIPDVEGGIERHAEQLYPLLADQGCSVEVLVRSPYHPTSKPLEFRGVRLRRLWSPRGGSLETVVHTLLGTLYACIVRPDVLHIHAVGPALFTPLARLLGLRVVVTHHGPDYDREKWNGFARWILRIGEWLGMRYSNERIAISKTIQSIVADRYGRSAVLIPNGVALPELPNSCTKVLEFGLVPGRYVLQVSRLVPEKRQLDLIRAFSKATIPEWKLALVGGIDRADVYVREVIRVSDQSRSVVLTGFQQGSPLQELYCHAGLFVLPSSHEGLPIALLEALSFGLPVIASDIPANVELGLPPESYFPLGNVEDLARRIEHFAAKLSESEQSKRVQHRRDWVAQRYNWPRIARQTHEVYRKAISPAAPSSRNS